MPSGLTISVVARVSSKSALPPVTQRPFDIATDALLHLFQIQDVKKINLKTKNHAVNKSLQNFMYTMLQDQDVTGEFLYFHISLHLKIIFLSII